MWEILCVICINLGSFASTLPHLRFWQFQENLLIEELRDWTKEEGEEEVDGIELPLEVWFGFFGFLDLRGKLICAQTCHQWRPWALRSVVSLEIPDPLHPVVLQKIPANQCTRLRDAPYFFHINDSDNNTSLRGGGCLGKWALQVLKSITDDALFVQRNNLSLLLSNKSKCVALLSDFTFLIGQLKKGFLEYKKNEPRRGRVRRHSHKETQKKLVETSLFITLPCFSHLVLQRIRMEQVK